jgi:hypothetical protein
MTAYFREKIFLSIVPGGKLCYDIFQIQIISPIMMSAFLA